MTTTTKKNAAARDTDPSRSRTDERTENMDETAERETRAWQAWFDAWDAARDHDKLLGRRYDKNRYAEIASEARYRALNEIVFCEACDPVSPLSPFAMRCASEGCTPEHGDR